MARIRVRVAPGSTKLGKNVLELHEDDWRQVEFVSIVLRDDIEADLASVREIYEQHRKGPGFDQIHVRKRITQPLKGTAVPVAERRIAQAGIRIAELLDEAFAPGRLD